ncbi:MAG: CAP domain-containing protein [Cyclobacteriaceae bacterium]|nr:CAP domain-containing protein [Cyclobacteriaceae bacterium]
MKLLLFALPLLFLFTSSIRENDQNTKTCLSAEERKLYNLILEYRKSNGLEPIPLSGKLTLVAQTHARDLADHYSFDPGNKCNPHSWSKKGKWTACCYTNDHKQAKCMWDKPREIAGYNSPGFEIAYYSSAGANAQEGIDGWKVSPGHNPLLINTGTWEKVKWKAIGIGIYKEYGVVWFGELEDDESTDQCP